MKVAITGASRGLGRALAVDFARDHDVIGISRSGMKIDVPNISEYKDCKGDINDVLFIKRVFQENCPDILINNAAVGFDGILATQSIENIDNLLQTNLRSTIVCCKFFIRNCLRQNKPGVIVNISSVTAIRGFQGLAVYSATKAGLLGLTSSLARETGAKGFRVNTVIPGYFESDMSAGLAGEDKQKIIRRTPLGRLATISDIVPVVRFLSSPTGFITGQCLVVDGGATC